MNLLTLLTYVSATFPYMKLLVIVRKKAKRVQLRSRSHTIDQDAYLKIV